MEKIPVQVRIDTRQTLEDGSSQAFVSRAAGHLYRKENGLYLAYRETGDNPREVTHTTWKIEPSQATLIRQGATGMKALFRPGMVDVTRLVTPHGSLPLEIRTFCLENRMSREGGRLRIGYHMQLGGAVSRMEVKLQVDSRMKGTDRMT